MEVIDTSGTTPTYTAFTSTSFTTTTTTTNITTSFSCYSPLPVVFGTERAQG